MVGRINNYIRSLNSGYSTTLTSNKVDYYNKLAKVKNVHEIEVLD